jgi:hypothetical protein
MNLPIINSPEFEAKIPSTGQEIFFRPFKVKEEKVLFMAMEGGEQKEIINAVTNVLSACITKGDVDIPSLAYFDIEYLFLKLRSKSVGEVVTLRFKHGNPDSECKHVQEYRLNLDEVQLKNADNLDDKIMLTDKIGVKLKYPNLQLAQKLGSLDMTKIDNVFGFIADSVEYIFDDENVYEETSRDDIKDWLENLDQAQFDKIMEFFNDMPKLSHSFTYACEKCGKEEKVHLEGLQSFFV